MAKAEPGSLADVLDRITHGAEDEVLICLQPADSRKVVAELAERARGVEFGRRASAAEARAVQLKGELAEARAARDAALARLGSLHEAAAPLANVVGAWPAETTS